MTYVYEVFDPPDAPSISRTTEEFICGVEYEIEDIKNYDLMTMSTNGIQIETDGSLRNNGKEFITSPQNYDVALEQFKLIHNSILLGSDPYTDRTSIHVHVNVNMLTMEQLKVLVLSYALFEPTFFNFAGKKRETNIHCVPLAWSIFPAGYQHDIKKIISLWNGNKYSAFNCQPVSKQGTVEFRHLYGTGNFETFRTWLRMIKNLYYFAKENNLETLKEKLKNGTSIRSLSLDLFGQASLFENDYNRSKMDVKLAFVNHMAAY